MQKVLDTDEYHIIKGCKFQCKPILLKEELKKVKENKNNPDGSNTHKLDQSLSRLSQEDDEDMNESMIVNTDGTRRQSLQSFSNMSQNQDNYYNNYYPQTAVTNHQGYQNYPGYADPNYQAFMRARIHEQGYGYPHIPVPIPVLIPKGPPHLELDHKLLARQKEIREAEFMAERNKLTGQEQQGNVKDKELNFKVTNLSNASQYSMQHSRNPKLETSTHYSISTANNSDYNYYYGPNAGNQQKINPETYSYHPGYTTRQQHHHHQVQDQQYAEYNNNQSAYQPKDGMRNFPTQAYSSQGYYPSHTHNQGPQSTKYLKEQQQHGIGVSNQLNEPQMVYRNPINLKNSEPQVLFEKNQPNLDRINFEVLASKQNQESNNQSMDARKKNPVAINIDKLAPVKEESVEKEYEKPLTSPQEIREIQKPKPQAIISKFSGMKYDNFQAGMKTGKQTMQSNYNSQLNNDDPSYASIKNKDTFENADKSEESNNKLASLPITSGVKIFEKVDTVSDYESEKQDSTPEETTNLMNFNKLPKVAAQIPEKKVQKTDLVQKQDRALDGFEAKRDLACETMTQVGAPGNKREQLERNYAARSVNFNAEGLKQAKDVGGDSGRLYHSSSKRMSDLSKLKSNEESSVHARDTDDILKFSQNDTRELFDVDNDLGNITELCDAEQLIFRRELKSGTFQSQKPQNSIQKYKTDGFLVSNIEIEDDEDDNDGIMSNMDIKRKVERGGSHNFNIYSNRQDKEGDFDFHNKKNKFEPIKEESMHESSVKDLQFSDDEDDGDQYSRGSGDGGRRRAGEVDFDF